MDFERTQRHDPDTGEIAEAVTEVRFDDTAELEFALGCLKALGLFIELEPPAHIEPHVQDSMAHSCEVAAERLQGLLKMGRDFNQGLLPRGFIGRNSFKSGHELTATTVMIAVDLVRNNADVRRHYPAEEADLLRIFVPDQK